jgi:hypothetical protein
VAEQDARPWQRAQELVKRTRELLAQRDRIALASEVTLERAKTHAHDAEARVVAAQARMTGTYGGQRTGRSR